MAGIADDANATIELSREQADGFIRMVFNVLARKLVDDSYQKFCFPMDRKGKVDLFLPDYDICHAYRPW